MLSYYNDYCIHYCCSSLVHCWVGLYLTFGPGGEQLTDPIGEHAKMHELGIAHGHTPKIKHD